MRHTLQPRHSNLRLPIQDLLLPIQTRLRMPHLRHRHPTTPLPPSPVYNSFYSIGCNAHTGVDGGWVISWGYNSVYDFAVMTVVNRDLQQDTWFGWNGVSKNPKFPDVGPNPVYALGTFT
ncbi:hypothetical protein DL98DRAFT_653861 [Cadophora sp. DSE1049]|nr:hypothetical protein DL98DRAFT_653861 [Cadophora sp. DSE1049]